MSRAKGIKNKTNKIADKVKEIEENIEINIDEIINNDNKTIETLSEVMFEVKPDISPKADNVIAPPKNRFQTEDYYKLTHDIQKLYASNISYENLEIFFRYHMIKCNLYFENYTRYWLDRFLHELPYMNIDIVKQLLKNENLL